MNLRRVETYDRFHRHIAAWADREIDSLMVVGEPGNGKSHAYQSALGNRTYHRFGGRQSPLHVYNTLCDLPHVPVVLDDISALLRDDNFRDMLKALCETGDRVIRWGTTTSKLDGRSTSFTCTAPVLIVLNKIPGRDPDVAAILDRCDAIEFTPTKLEVITRMREIFPDDGGLIELLAELPAMPSFRTLIKARAWERSTHLNLAQELLSECGVPPAVAQLAEIIATCPENEWCSRYMADTGLTERTYRRHKALALQLAECRASANACPNVRDQPVTTAIENGGDEQ
jgi:hypothetical protein